MKKTISIRNKIIFYFAMFFTVLIVLIALLVNYAYDDMIMKQFSEDKEQDAKRIASRLDSVLASANHCANSVIITLNIALEKNAVSFNEPILSNEYVNKKILAIIDSHFLLFPNIKQISIVYDNGDLYYKDEENNYKYIKDQSSLYSNLKTENLTTKGEWIKSSFIEHQQETNSTSYFAKTLRDTFNNKDLGYVIVGVDEAVMSNTYSSIEDVTYFIINKDDVVVSSNLKDEIGLLYNEDAEKIKDLKYEFSLVDGWRLISIVDIDNALSRIDQTVRILFLISVLFLVVAIAIIYFLSNKITGSMRNVAKKLVSFEGGLPQKLPDENYSKEIETLVLGFNEMADRNLKLFENVQKEQQTRRKLEFELLQSQIKPHFLYNTLDTVFCLNNLGQYERANSVTRSLAEYYRTILSKGNDRITIEKEIFATKKYLEIQQIRYSDMLSYDININEDILGIKIPKLTLQPIVENAIYHGIKPKGEAGRILINGYEKDNFIIIEVCDTGEGMTREVFEKVMEKDRKESSFGLYNVLERLRINFGNSSNISIGTKDNMFIVKIVFRLKGERENEI